MSKPKTKRVMPNPKYIRHVLTLHSPETMREWKLDILRRLPWADRDHYAMELKDSYIRRVTGEFYADAAALPKGTLCIDLGAHLGKVSERLAKHGLRVISFEPDPVTFEKLTERLGSNENAELINAAVGVEAGTMTLVRNHHWTPEGLEGSMGSTLLRSRREIIPELCVDVEVIDFIDFLSRIDEPIGILKIDIEGGEYTLIPALLESGALDKVAHLYVETHEWIETDKRALVAGWRQMAKSATRPKMHFDWV